MLAPARRTATMGGWVAELDGKPDLGAATVRWSDETYRIFGHAPGAPGNPRDMFFAAVHPGDLERVGAAIREALEKSEDYDIDFRIVRADAAVRRVHAQSRIERHAASGLPLRMIGAVQDVTELYEQRRTAASQDALLAAVFEASGDSIYTVDAQLRLTSMNRAYQRRAEARLGAAVLPGHCVLDVGRTAAERERLCASLGRALAGERFMERLQYAAPEGAVHWFDVLRAPLRGPEGAVEGVAVYAKDVTQDMHEAARARDVKADLERRIAERTGELAALNGELEAFAYSISHDLRAPLRAIDGFARIIERDYSAAFPEPARQHFGRIREAAQRMGSLIEGLLAFSRLGRKALELQEHDVAAVVRTALDDLAADREGREVELVLGELGRCRADRRLLTQVFANLIGNALKYTRGRSPARIEVRSQQGPSGRVWCVADNGVGFDLAHAQRLFGVFQRLHRSEDYEGTGVGLALVKRIVERHGGRVWAEAEPGRGATFFFTLEGA